MNSQAPHLMSFKVGGEGGHRGSNDDPPFPTPYRAHVHERYSSVNREFFRVRVTVRVWGTVRVRV